MNNIEKGCWVVLVTPCKHAMDSLDQDAPNIGDSHYVLGKDNTPGGLCSHQHWWIGKWGVTAPECGLMRIDGKREEFDINEDRMRLVDA